MEEVLKTAVNQVPALTVLVVLVVLFLRFLQGESKSREAADKARDERLKEIGTACHDFQRELAGATGKQMERMSNAFDSNTKALIENTTVIRHFESTIAKS